MSEDKFDAMMKEAMAPSFVPSEELNKRIMNAAPKKKAKVTSFIPRVAAIAAAVLLVGSIGVYAGSRLYRKVTVTDHAITVGNTDYLDDEALASAVQDTSSIGVDESCDTVITEYDSYAEAKEATGLGFDFCEEYDQIGKVSYTVTSGTDYKFMDLTGTFRYSRGKFNFSYSTQEGNIAEDMAYSVYLENTTNERDYTLDNGNTFTLVDEVKEDVTTTYVMISYDDVYGYLRFYDLTDDEIIHVLNTLDVDVGKADKK